MTPMSAATRVRVQGLAILAAVFVSGALAGAAIEHLRTPARVEVMAPSPALVPTADVVTNMKLAVTGVPVVYEALGLTEDQRQRIRAIVDANRSRTDSLLRTTWPALRAVLDTVQGQVDQILTADQRSRLTAMRRGAAASAAPGGLPNGRNPR
jgi:hypothetical protein